MADELLMTLPEPRIDYYQSSVYDVIQRKVTGYTSQLVDDLGFFPVSVDMDLLDQMQPEGRARALGVRYTPTFIFLSGGSELGRIIERPKVSLQDDIERMLVK